MATNVYLLQACHHSHILAPAGLRPNQGKAYLDIRQSCKKQQGAFAYVSIGFCRSALPRADSPRADWHSPKP